MITKAAPPRDIDEYIDAFPQDVREILQQIRATIRKAAPDGEETISYQIPTYTLNGTYLVYFAAFKKHVAVYPAPHRDVELREELSAYRSGKGTVKFTLDKPIPLELIGKIVHSLAKENLERAEEKRKKK